MLMPSLLNGSLWDDLDFFTSPFDNRHERVNTQDMMRTDVKETEDGYEVIMNLPGFAKDDVKGELKDGYLVISASTNNSNDTKDEEGRYIRRERYSGSCSRSFYVGDQIELEDIKAKFEDGTLRLQIPKKEPAKKVENKRYIAIEG